MDERGIADPTGFILTLLSLPLIFGGVVAVLRSIQRESSRRRLADLATSKVPTDFGQAKALREALANWAAPDRLPELWLYAFALRSRRWMLPLQTGVLMGSWRGPASGRSASPAW
ncbi:hypothetical protein GCM10022223_51190 [Kineosporia mesophila]|uniref:Uncharacterized protein n=1 Tax=Kineosporia mesophila TaxID=566012 RepID=A0ABP7A9Y1_9ACTN|nr:hypothetical protein [Kineosporia mesophila]MCD5354692.1 hypothetical protein [Kineosporia mesophila]